MRRILLFLAVVGACMGCSGSQGSVPDYEIVSEHEKDVSNLKVKSINVSTESTKEQELRQITAELKSENTGYDALSIQFHRDTQGESASQDAGTAIVVNNEEAADKMLPDILFTDADRRRILNEKNDGILVISLADIKLAEKEIQKAQKGLERDLQEMERGLEKGMPKLPKP